ncbi:MAG: hypothetical protein HC850_11170 [Rhodomicrobium sp.]|nr:hypothetical protein [Rhodomicrobium sp.]
MRTIVNFRPLRTEAACRLAGGAQAPAADGEPIALWDEGAEIILFPKVRRKTATPDRKPLNRRFANTAQREGT